MKRLLMLTAALLLAFALSAHHYKGLPHYSYFEHYPQVPVDEFIGQAGEYEMSLVIYDFQGMEEEEQLGRPEDARLFLIIFNLHENITYKGRLLMEVLDGGKVLYAVEHETPEEENVYRLNHKLPSGGSYSLRITMKDENNLGTEIPFVLTSQKTNWAKWVGMVLLVLVIVLAIGSRKKRILLDRKKG